MRISDNYIDSIIDWRGENVMNRGNVEVMDVLYRLALDLKEARQELKKYKDLDRKFCLTSLTNEQTTKEINEIKQ